jgi:glycosyltransferase involved in cell wall biosynthesis
LKSDSLRLLVVDPGSNFLQFLSYLPPSITIEKCPAQLLRGPTGLFRRGLWRAGRDSKIRRYASKFDVVFCEYASSWAAILSRNTNVPVIVRAHQFEFDYRENLDAINWANVDMLVTVSRHYEELARKMTPVHDVRLVENGIDTSGLFTFEPCESSRLCTYSHHQPRKRIYDLMLALRDYELHIGGDGPSYRVNEEAIQRFSLKHKLYGRVNIPSWLRDKEFFLFHSMDESCGVALLEAMASGLLCLSHDFAVAGEILPKEYRYVYDDELIKKIESVSQLDPESRRERKKGLRKIVESRFDVNRQAADFAKLFFELGK